MIGDQTGGPDPREVLRVAREEFAEHADCYPTQYGTAATWDQLSEEFRAARVMAVAARLDALRTLARTADADELHFLDANEKLGDALTEVGMILGLAKLRSGATWGAREVIERAHAVVEWADVDRATADDRGRCQDCGEIVPLRLSAHGRDDHMDPGCSGSRTRRWERPGAPSSSTGPDSEGGEEPDVTGYIGALRRGPQGHGVVRIDNAGGADWLMVGGVGSAYGNPTSSRYTDAQVEQWTPIGAMPGTPAAWMSGEPIPDRESEGPDE